MTIEQAGNFLIGSILVGLGFCILTVSVLVINNLLHKYWKPVTWGFMPESMKAPYRYEQVEAYEPKIEPTLDDKVKK